MKCCLNTDGHFAIEPILATCGGNACKNCIINFKEETIPCYCCNQKHEKKDLTNSPINNLAEVNMKYFLNDLFHDVVCKLESKEFNGWF